MRGKLEKSDIEDDEKRITPAGAGKTTEKRVSKLQNGDHPRRCGENFACGVGGDVVKGSPPQVRGKPGYTDEAKKPLRITPAGAGKTKRKSRHHVESKDHPRRCGENALITGIADDAPGSPPQVRGKQPFEWFAGIRVGITPAGAGKT